jgi:stress-induced-phosphoprotein 1
MSDDNIKKAEEIKLKANELFKHHKYSEALSLYIQALELDSKEVTYHLNIAGCYHQMKEYDKVVEHCQKVLDETFDFGKKCKALGRMGFAFQEKGDLVNAIKCFEDALLEKTDSRIKEALKNAQALKKKKDEEAYRDPVKAEEANKRGNDLYKEHKFAEAIFEYSEAIKRDPTHAKYFSNRAACYIKVLSFNEALSDCEQALALDSTFLRAHQRYCTVLFLLKRYHKSLTAYEKALKLYPDDSELKEGYYKCVSKINESGDDDERLKQTMNDPEIQGLLIDPRVQQFLKDLKENPKSANEAILKDEFLRETFRKLVAAGIIKTK